MAPTPEVFSDTSPKVMKIWIEMLRKRSVGQRLLDTIEMSDIVWAFESAGIKMRHPAASDREIFLRMALKRLGRDLAEKAYGQIPLED